MTSTSKALKKETNRKRSNRLSAHCRRGVVMKERMKNRAQKKRGKSCVCATSIPDM